MQSRIADELVRTDLTSQIQNAIQSAISFYSTRRFQFNEGKAVRNTAASDEYVGLPTDFLGLDTLGITINSRYYQLIQRTHDYLDEINWSAGTYTGAPTAFSLYEENLRLYPIPDDTYELTITYLKDLSDLSASADTNAWMTTGEELIRMHAKVDLLENVIRGPEALQEAGRMRLREQEVLQQMDRSATTYRSTGRIRPSVCY